MPLFYCLGADADNITDCAAQNGLWTASNTDYSIESDENDVLTGLVFDRVFSNDDVITVKWFNNNIGTTLEIDEIIEETDKKYVSSSEVNLTGTVRVTDYNNPAWPNVEENGNTVVNASSVNAIFDLIYPIGHIIENGINPNNPATYMGFGAWQLFGEKRMTVGWTKDNGDTLFHLNNNDLDSSGNPSATAGGTGGGRNVTLTNADLPATTTDEKVLVADDNGAVVVGGCQFDPDDQGPAYNKYREDFATTNKTHLPGKSIDTLSPYITVYRWMRIA